MDESAIKATKAMKGLELNGSDADKKKSSVTMMVSGYDKSLPVDDIKSLLSEHFSSCGEITKVYIATDVYIPNKYAFVYITGEDAQEKALQLNGSDFRGRNLRVEVMPPSTECCNVTPELAAVTADVNYDLRRTFTVVITGFDPLVPAKDNEKALREHFSSCGKISTVVVHRDPIKKASLVIKGDGVPEKVQALNGCDMGGWNVQVLGCDAFREITFNRVYGVRPVREKYLKKPKMTSE